MIRALIVAVLLSAVSVRSWAADAVPETIMRFELLRDDVALAAIEIPRTGGSVAEEISQVGRLSVACPAPVTAGDGVVVYRNVVIDLVEPGDQMALTTTVSASFASGGMRKVIGICARGQFAVSFPE